MVQSKLVEENGHLKRAILQLETERQRLFVPWITLGPIQKLLKSPAPQVLIAWKI